jgi:hypothetical protein
MNQQRVRSTQRTRGKQPSEQMAATGSTKQPQTCSKTEPQRHGQRRRARARNIVSPHSSRTQRPRTSFWRTTASCTAALAPATATIGSAAASVGRPGSATDAAARRSMSSASLANRSSWARRSSARKAAMSGVAAGTAPARPWLEKSSSAAATAAPWSWKRAALKELTAATASILSLALPSDCRRPRMKRRRTDTRRSTVVLWRGWSLLGRGACFASW